MKQNQKQMKRDRDFNLRLSEPEYIYLKKCAEGAEFRFKNGRVNFSGYVRSMLLEKSGYKNTTYLRQLRDVAYELRKIGTNVNQIAKKINQGYIGSSEDLAELKAYLERIEKTFDELKTMYRNPVQKKVWKVRTNGNHDINAYERKPRHSTYTS